MLFVFYLNVSLYICYDHTDRNSFLAEVCSSFFSFNWVRFSLVLTWVHCFLFFCCVPLRRLSFWFWTAEMSPLSLLFLRLNKSSSLSLSFVHHVLQPPYHTGRPSWDCSSMLMCSLVWLSLLAWPWIRMDKPVWDWYILIVGCYWRNVLVQASLHWRLLLWSQPERNPHPPWWWTNHLSSAQTV